VGPLAIRCTQPLSASLSEQSGEVTILRESLNGGSKVTLRPSRYDKTVLAFSYKIG
jgi:hypothetical protein